MKDGLFHLRNSSVQVLNASTFEGHLGDTPISGISHLVTRRYASG